MKFLTQLVAVFCISCLLSACGPEIPDEVALAEKSLPDKIDFNLHVKPILSDRCFACHGPDKNNQKAGLRLDLEEQAKDILPENPGHYAIVEGSTGKSQLVNRILNTDPEIAMPPPESNLVLTPYEKAVLIKWIEEGAEYKPHWSFISPKKNDLPKVKNKDWGNNPIDQFILAKLDQQGFEPSGESDKETLLRRVTFDLTGLPPTLKEMEDFLNDDSPKAYEKVVDRLLASPRYGERMAVDWLDVARFADTHGYTVDRYRDMSPWRDWVIKSFNENQPFDEFIQWQMAGDMMPNPSREQILATGFNRNHQQNMEGGIVDEEFRVEYVADRTNTLGAAFLGLTIECARCHDHKYDPISQKEYFQLYSFFNNVNEAGQISYDDSPAVPTLLLTDEESQKAIDFLNEQMTSKEKTIEKIEQEALKGFEDWLENERPKLSVHEKIVKGAVAHFDLNKRPIVNKLRPSQRGTMKQMHFQKAFDPVFTEGKMGKGLMMDGDAWLDLGEVGVFDRSMPFSVGIWVNLPDQLKNGVIFHKGEGAALYNFRGYHLALKDNRLEVLLAHTTPNNAIIEYADSIPRNEWIHLTMTYDGTSKASGLKIYLNGKELETEIAVDNLYKGILFPNRKTQPGLQIGARWRGAGIRKTKVDEIKVWNRTLTPPEIAKVYEPKAFVLLTVVPTSKLSHKEKEGWKSFYLDRFASQRKPLEAELRTLRKQQYERIDTIREVMVMEEMKTPRQAFILERGQYDSYGEAVFPETPESVLPMPKDLPKNRLGLAKWLTSAENPLTARVTVNRFWQSLFGRGLVKTAEDFGSQGDLPSHPELLDWLAVEFQESEWDVKALMKQMVLSATYRQSSITSEELRTTDPENVWLARGPAVRLSAEMMRDNALAASDLLVGKIGGKSVKPYQPEGLWRMNSGNYDQSEGDGLYRRSLYTFWKRSVPHPTQSTFDAPTRSNCTVRRQKTSTPLQALVLMNDPAYVEAARVIGEQITEAPNPEEGITQAFRKLTGRKPAAKEVAFLMELRDLELKSFRTEPERMKGWMETGVSRPAESLDLATVAANSVVASTLINTDATLMKR